MYNARSINEYSSLLGCHFQHYRLQWYPTHLTFLVEVIEKFTLFVRVTKFCLTIRAFKYRYQGYLAGPIECMNKYQTSHIVTCTTLHWLVRQCTCHDKHACNEAAGRQSSTEAYTRLIKSCRSHHISSSVPQN